MSTFDVILQAGMILSGGVLFTLMAHEVYTIIRADYRRQSRRTAARKGGR